MIDDRAARAFAKAAEDYAAYRPSYPPEAVAFIRARARLDESSTVVDLGAGTGLMTRLLLPVGRLIAVEPVAEMRAALRACVTEAEVMQGTAEELPLTSAIADAIVVAQAFHWFANTRAVSEMARVLKPAGALVLVWNENDLQHRIMAEIDAILAPYRLDSPCFDSTPWRAAFEEQGSPLRLETHETFPYEETLTLQQLKGRVLSISYVALLKPSQQSAVLARLEELVGSKSNDTAVTMKHRTEAFVARRR